MGALPVSMASVIMAAIVLRWMFPPENLDLGPAVQKLDQKVSDMGRMSGREWTTLVVIATMIFCVVRFGSEYGLGTVALMFIAILFDRQTLQCEDADRYVTRGVALIYGGAIAI